MQIYLNGLKEWNYSSRYGTIFDFFDSSIKNKGEKQQDNQVDTDHPGISPQDWIFLRDNNETGQRKNLMQRSQLLIIIC